MKGFDPNSMEPKGRMINKVRETIKSIEKGESIDRLRELLGEPDEIGQGKLNHLSDLAQEQISSGMFGGIAQKIFKQDNSSVEET